MSTFIVNYKTEVVGYVIIAHCYSTEPYNLNQTIRLTAKAETLKEGDCSLYESGTRRQGEGALHIAMWHG